MNNVTILFRNNYKIIISISHNAMFINYLAKLLEIQLDKSNQIVHAAKLKLG